MSKTGIVLGSFGGRTLRFDGEENVLLVGGQRQGKGVGIIIPTLLELREHVIVIDVRGQTWNDTAGWCGSAAHGGRALRLQLTQPGSTRKNLLDEIRKGPSEFRDAAMLAEMAVNPNADPRFTNEHWKQTSRAVLTCGMLYEKHRCWRPTMSNIASFWTRPGTTMVQTLTHIVETAPTKEVAELAQEVLIKGAREGAGVVSSMMTQLFVFRDPLIQENTRTSDFMLDDFLRPTPPWTALYLVLTPGEEEFVRPFMRMLLRLACQRWMEESPQKCRITLIMDEFTSLGQMQFFEENLARLGGRGIRTLLAVQNIPQLDIYGTPARITEQCKVRCYFGAQGPTTGRAIQHEVGTGTATTKQESQRSEGWSWLMADSQTIQEQQHARPLLTESEATEIPDDTMIIKKTGAPPIWAKKLRFYTKRRWRTRSQIPAPAWRQTP
jgi:type IV secretion system protein VirD4